MQGLSNNRKIRNACPHEYGGIKFKSGLELTVYKVLLEGGYNPLYEQKTYPIFEGYSPSIPFLTKNTFSRKNCNIEVISSSTVLDKRKVTSWNYTPDFYIEYKNHIIFIEVKGYYNDVARYKQKLFRWKLEGIQEHDSEHVYEYWEIHTKKQLLECLNNLIGRCV